MLFLNIGFMVRKSNHVDRLISNNLGPDPTGFSSVGQAFTSVWLGDGVFFSFWDI